MNTMMKKILAASGLAAAITAVSLMSSPASTAAFSQSGGRLGLDQRDFRIYNNFTNVEANNNVAGQSEFPQYVGATLAIWKAHVEWGSEQWRADGAGDPTQSSLGDGMANFDNTMQGETDTDGGMDGNVHAVEPANGPICGSGILAYCQGPNDDGWAIRYCDAWAWDDGPGEGDGLLIGGQTLVDTLANDAIDVEAADVDGDGHIDLFAALKGSGEVVWYPNGGGDGTFGSPRVLSTGFQNLVPVKLHASDIDLDGDQDLLVAADSFDTAITELHPIDHIDGEYGSAAHAEDMDGDGDLDLVVASHSGISLFVNKISEGGSLEFEEEWHDSQPGQDLHVGDFNGDGAMDIVSSSWVDDTISWFENVGNWSFTKQLVSHAGGAYLDGPLGVHAVDIEGDGDVDILSASQFDSKVTLWLNSTSPSSGMVTFNPFPISAPGETQGASDVYAADFDGDGDLDIVASSRSDGKITWFEHAQTTSWYTPGQVITTSASSAMSVYAEDMDGDGDMDVLSASLSDSTVAWYENLGHSGGPPVPGTVFSDQKEISTSMPFARHVYAEDMDGDGDMDVLGASFNDDTIAGFENFGNGQFSNKLIVTSELEGAGWVHAGDFDGDNDLDIVASGFSQVNWYENQPLGGYLAFVNEGGGTFASGWPFALGNGPRDITTADLTFDGYPEVLIASADDNEIAWIQNISTGGKRPLIGFGPKQVISNNVGGVSSVVAGDFDGDQRVDVAATGWSDDSVSWWHNAIIGGTEPAFGHQQYLSQQTPGASDIQAGDLDGDGSLDLVVAAERIDQVSWYRNLPNTSNVFSNEIVLTNGASAVSRLAIADLDDDGDNDLLSANQDSDSVVYYENVGQAGAFTDLIYVSTDSIAARAVIAADVVGLNNAGGPDGKPDIIAASPGDNTVAVFKNLSGTAVIDLQAVATHEVGHSLGLGHSNDQGATMSAFMAYDLGGRSIEFDDTEGVASLYGYAGANKTKITNAGQSSFSIGDTLSIWGENFSPTGNRVWFTRNNGNDGDPVVSDTADWSGSGPLLITIPGNVASGAFMVKASGSGFETLSNPWPFELDHNPTNNPPVMANITPNTGGEFGWEYVTIKGHSLAQVHAVRFIDSNGNSVPAIEFEIVGSGEILALTPPCMVSNLPATVDVKVFNSAGDDTLYGAYTYVGHTGISIDEVIPNEGDVAGGETVIIKGANVAGIQNVFFGGASAHGVTQIDGTTLTCVIPGSQASGSVDVTGVDLFGSTSMIANGFTYTDEGQFTEIHPGLAGLTGIPYLHAEGDLTPGTGQFHLTCEAIAPFAPGTMLISLQLSQLTFKGGTLYTYPIALNFNVQASMFGDYQALGTIPLGTHSGMKMYMQMVFLDFEALHNVSMSNGLELLVP